MLLIIDNYDSFTYNLYQLLAPYYPEIKVVRNDALTVDEIAALQPKGILLSPGPGRPEEAGICLELIRRFAPEIPLFGVCLGHQAIGMAFGGKVVPAKNIMHGKSSPVFHARQGIFQKLPLPFQAGRYHSLIVERESLPKELIVEAETGEGTIMAMRHESYPCYGVQFHPESILTSHGELLLREFLDKEVKRC